MLFGYLLHQPHSRPVGNLLDRFVPAGLLFGAKVWSRKDLLHAEDLHALLRRLLDKAQVLFNVQAFDIFNWQIRWRRVGCLN